MLCHINHHNSLNIITCCKPNNLHIGHIVITFSIMVCLTTIALRLLVAI